MLKSYAKAVVEAFPLYCRVRRVVDMVIVYFPGVSVTFCCF